MEFETVMSHLVPALLNNAVDDETEAALERYIDRLLLGEPRYTYLVLCRLLVKTVDNVK